MGTFSVLKVSLHFPNWMFFRYLQVQYACRQQFPNPLTLDQVERLLTAKVLTAPLSLLYFRLSLAFSSKLTQAFLIWQQDIPTLTEEDWEDCVSSYNTTMISARDRFVQLKFLHRAYYTPQRLVAIYADGPSSCPCCRVLKASFIHMVWSCSSLQRFWEQVLSDLIQVTGSTLELDPKGLLLNIYDDPALGRYTKLFLSYATYYAHTEKFCSDRRLRHCPRPRHGGLNLTLFTSVQSYLC